MGRKKDSKVTPILIKKYAAIKNVYNLINLADGEGHIYIRFPSDPKFKPAVIHNFEASTKEYREETANYLHLLAEKIRKGEPLEDA